MRKILVFQHAAHEILGTLNPLLKSEKFRVRYINFSRTPDAKPTVDKYNGLIVLGGHMGVYEADKYKHLEVEIKLIEQALKKEVPILGICLGSQILAHVLGAHVRKHTEREIGWCDVNLTAAGKKDPLLSHFENREKIFQMHGDTFDTPKSAVHLATSDVCPGQAFCYNKKAYGLQFHLEVDQAMITRWLKMAHNKKLIDESNGKLRTEVIEEDTSRYLMRSLILGTKTFTNFLGMFGKKERPIVLGSGGKSPRG